MSKSDFGLWGQVGFLLHGTSAISSISFAGEGQSQISRQQLPVLFCKPSVVCWTPHAQEWLHFEDSLPWGQRAAEAHVAPGSLHELQTASNAPDAFLQTCWPRHLAVSCTCLSRGKVLCIFKAFMGCLMLPLPATLLCSTVYYAKYCAFRVYPVMPLSCPSVFISFYPFFHLILANTDTYQSQMSTFMLQSYLSHQNIISIVLSASQFLVSALSSLTLMEIKCYFGVSRAAAV